MTTPAWHTRQRIWTDPAGRERHSWEYVLELASIGGQRQRVTRGGFRTEKAMKEALQRELQARQGGTFAEPSRGSFADYLTNTWLPWIEEHRRPTTHDLYTRMARLHVVPALGAIALQDLRPLDVESFYMALGKPGPGRPKGLGYNSVRNVAVVVHGSLQKAVQWRLLGSNPARDVAPPTGPRTEDDGEPAHWTAAEVAAFLDHVDATFCHERTVTERRKRRNGVEYTYCRTLAPDPMQRALWYTLATTGMRRGEACGLQWRDLDAEGGLLSVRRSRVDVGGRVVESAPKTRRGRRRIALDPATLAVLAEWRRVQRRERMEYRKVWEDTDDHVFTHAVHFSRPPRYGVVVMPNWITAAFRELQESSGLPRLHLHGLRHSWATAALDAGEHLRAVADHLGHADTAVTDRTYTHTVRRVQDVTALRVAELITSKRGGGEGQ